LGSATSIRTGYLETTLQPSVPAGHEREHQELTPLIGRRWAHRNVSGFGFNPVNELIEGTIAVGPYSSSVVVSPDGYVSKARPGQLTPINPESLVHHSALLGNAWPNPIAPSSGLARGIENWADVTRPNEFNGCDTSFLKETAQGVFDRALGFLSLLPKNIPSPQARPSPDGEVGFFWSHKKNRVDAYLDADGNFTWIGKFDDQFVKGGDVEWRGHLPIEFLGMLNHLYA
jgi:hypothetical protein